MSRKYEISLGGKSLYGHFCIRRIVDRIIFKLKRPKIVQENEKNCFAYDKFIIRLSATYVLFPYLYFEVSNQRIFQPMKMELRTTYKSE